MFSENTRPLHQTKFKMFIKYVLEIHCEGFDAPTILTYENSAPVVPRVGERLFTSELFFIVTDVVHAILTDSMGTVLHKIIVASVPQS